MKNKQNYRCWSRVLPEWGIEDDRQNTWKINVWAGIVGDNIIGPYFFDGRTITAAKLTALIDQDLNHHLANNPVRINDM